MSYRKDYRSYKQDKKYDKQKDDKFKEKSQDQENINEERNAEGGQKSYPRQDPEKLNRDRQNPSQNDKDRNEFKRKREDWKPQEQKSEQKSEYKRNEQSHGRPDQNNQGNTWRKFEDNSYYFRQEEEVRTPSWKNRGENNFVEPKREATLMADESTTQQVQRDIDNAHHPTAEHTKNEMVDDKDSCNSPMDLVPGLTLTFNEDKIQQQNPEVQNSLIFSEFNWSKAASTNNDNQMQSQNNCPKCKKELYIGNLPSEVGVQKLIDLMNKQQRERAISATSDPVMSAWINQEQKFGFIELRTEEDATNGLKLNQQILCNKNVLKIGRPKKSGNHVHRTNLNSSTDIQMDNELLMQPVDLDFLNSIRIDNINFNSRALIEGAGIETQSFKELKEIEQNIEQSIQKDQIYNDKSNGKKISQIELYAAVGKCLRSKLLILMDIVQKEDGLEQPQEIEEAIQEKCAAYGKLVTQEMVMFNETVNVVVLFETESMAADCREALNGKKFENKKVNIFQIDWETYINLVTCSLKIMKKEY